MCNRLTPSSKGRTEPAFVNFFVHLTVHAKFCTSCLLYHFLHSADNTIIDSFQARRRLIEN